MSFEEYGLSIIFVLTGIYSLVLWNKSPSGKKKQLMQIALGLLFIGGFMLFLAWHDSQ
jgi:hypothetical protein